MIFMMGTVTRAYSEIGIRKSLGARTKDILMQFLIESVTFPPSEVDRLHFLNCHRIGGHELCEHRSCDRSEGDHSCSWLFRGGRHVLWLYPARKPQRDPIEALRYEFRAAYVPPLRCSAA